MVFYSYVTHPGSLGGQDAESALGHTHREQLGTIHNTTHCQSPGRARPIYCLTATKLRDMTSPEPAPAPPYAPFRAGLIAAAAPIGNPGDASPRLAAALAGADLIAAEDTRRLKRLMTDLGVETHGPILSCHEHNESGRVTQVLEAIAAGKQVLLITDAGMPGVSDPGYRMIHAVTQAGHVVTCLPGPSAVTTALLLSGLPTDRFTFEGFPPRKTGDQTRTFTKLADEPRTMVFFESPRRLADTLGVMSEVFGPDRAAAVSRELTKTYEETQRGSLGDLHDWASTTEILGEITLCIQGAPATPTNPEDALPEVLALVDAGTRLKDATKQIAQKHDLSSRDLYTLALEHKNT